MSRSYRKTPEISKDGGGKFGKKEANKKVRKTKNIPDGKAYKKIYCSWNICDWKTWWSISDAFRMEIKRYNIALEKLNGGVKLWKYERDILKRRIPTRESIYSEMKRWGK